LKYGLQQSQNKRKVVLALGDNAELVYLSSPKFENEEGVITKKGLVVLLSGVKMKNIKFNML
jgi:hypothetical protein